jgi:type II secretion system protein N
MRSAAGFLVLLVVSCGSGSTAATSGPVESMVSETPKAMRIKAVRHRLELAALPVSGWIGLPVRGTIEVDAAVTVPIVGGRREFEQAVGSIAVRCIGTCTIGDDVTRLYPAAGASGRDAFFADGIAFSHIDLTGFEAEVTIADGKARLTHFQVTSPDLQLSLSLSLSLTATLSTSNLDGCLHLRPTDALRERDPRLHELVSLASPTQDDDGAHHIQFGGSVAEPRIMSRICELQ